MNNPVRSSLTPIRNRQRRLFVVQSLVAGIAIGGTVSFFVAAGTRLTGTIISFGWLLVVPLIVGFVAATVAVVRNYSWRDAAIAVDKQYRLKDRVVTALEFSLHGTPSALQRLQIEDALLALRGTDAREVVPLGLPAWTWLAPVSVLAALLVLLLPLQTVPVAAAATRGVDAGAVAEQLADDLDDLKVVAEQSDLDEFERLVAELQQRTEQLKDPKTDLPMALATLSDMQQQLAAQQRELSISATDTQLKSLGDALDAAENFQPAAESLRQGDLNAAAERLEATDAEKLNPREAKAAADKLAEVAKAMQDAGMKKLSETTSDMSEAVRDKNADAVRKSATDMAGQVRQHAARKQLAEMLQAQSMKLAESKNAMRMGAARVAGESQRGSETQTTAKGRTDQKSENASSSTGAKTAGNIDGERTKLDSQRQMARLTGQLGADGDSDFETESAEFSPQDITREAQEAYGDYRKLSDAVLDSESLPLGHRQLIRRYFESIRPTAQSIE